MAAGWYAGAGNGEAFVAIIDDLTVGTRVTVPLGRALRRAVVVEPGAAGPDQAATVRVRLEPPVKAPEPGAYTTHLVCEACRIDLGWIELPPA